MKKEVNQLAKKFEERDKVREEIKRFKEKMDNARIEEAKINAEIESLKGR